MERWNIAVAFLDAVLDGFGLREACSRIEQAPKHRADDLVI